MDNNKKIKILIVDDDPISGLLSEATIHIYSRDFEILRFELPQEALDYLGQLSSDDWPKLIFLDVEMPLLSGWQILDQLGSKISSQGQNTMINMLTSSISQENRVQFDARGEVSLYLNKPLNTRVLDTVIENYNLSFHPEIMIESSNAQV
ncbi:response regulator [Reichenbachiella carrageenanivorans]|uniref:Response regulator n=1 Tax=Reichenbachiella carrageenanivorans TaxID=2979869 RepID=A0ABY6D460_9BACT|nr:response regulator [Reichenbachiella carrageenanivorans]UXX79843.1 response regulator [Reichenbachiella carrageenanivorans]